MILLLLVLLLPISVYAGTVGTFFSTIFNSLDEEILLSNKSVQTMALLTTYNTSLVDDQTLHAPIIENNALVSNLGPLTGDTSPLAHKPTSDQISVYVVRSGDTLSQIAEMFNVTVNTIKWSNDLPSNTLKEGQTLVILPISGVKHTVVKGDKIKSLATKYKGDMEEILSYNNLQQEDSLIVGSIIIIPDGEVLPSASSNTSFTKSGNSSSLKEYNGYYMKPVVGGRKTQGIHGYNGVDIAAPVGTPILAAADGEVIISRSGSWNGGYGNYIVIRHDNGTQTLYSHNNKNNVSAGDNVNQGDVIGSVGSSGKSTGSHVHFEIRGAKNPF